MQYLPVCREWGTNRTDRFAGVASFLERMVQGLFAACEIPVARELVGSSHRPAGLHSGPKTYAQCVVRQTLLAGFGTAAQSSGSELPRHRRSRGGRAGLLSVLPSSLASSLPQEGEPSGYGVEVVQCLVNGQVGQHDDLLDAQQHAALWTFQKGGEIAGHDACRRQ